MAAPRDYVTVLTAQGRKILAKRHRRLPNGGGVVTTSYDKATMFRLSQRPVSSIDDVGKLLRELAGKPSSCIVRGDPAPDVDWGKPQKRRFKTRRKADGTVEPATLISAARRLIQLDFDRLECPPEIDQYDEPDRVVDHVITLLPEPFHGTTCCWDFTGSAGIKPGISLRLRFWADRPVTDEELKIWLTDSPVDHSIFAPAQPIYTAAPIFEGMADPVPFRSGTRTGYSDEVAVPAIERPQPRASAPGTSSAGYAGSMGSGYAAHRGRIGDGPLRNGFLAPIKSAVAAWIGENGAGADTAWLRADLEQAIREAPRDPGKHPDDYVEKRVDDLDPLIAAIRGFQAEKESAAAEPIEPTYAAPLGSVAEARRVLARTMHDIVDQVRGYRATLAQLQEDDERPPPAWAINVDVGLGKTRAFREIVVAVMVRDGLPVALAVPRHKLGDENVTDFAAAGITARVYRGRTADDPDAPGETMCREIERVNEIFGALGDIEKHACRNRRTGDTCPFYETCGYQRQKQAMPQVWLIPHELLFHRRPIFIPAPAVLGIDESFWGSSLQGTENPITVDASDLTSDRTVPGPGVFDSADLTETSRRAHEAITGLGDGYIRRDTLIRAGLTADDLRNAQRLEWRRKLSLDDVLPGMPRREAIRLCRKVKERNRVVGRLARLWDLLARQLEGELDVSPWVERRADEDGEPVVYMAWRRDINESWSAPTVVMDATMQPAIVQAFFPQIGEPVQVSAPMPHVRVRQITDRPMSSAMLVETAGASDHRNQSRRNNVERLRRYIEVRGDAVAPGRGLVVCQQAVEAALKAGALPSNIEIAHFNDITGLNAWSDIASLTAIGRTEPSPSSVERLARALFGITPVEVAPNDKGNVSYPRVARGIRMRDGTGRKVEGNQHPDARVEALRWAICEAELIQAIGRGRGVNRSADNPLQIDTLTNVVLPIEVDETTTWDRIQPTLAETMRARGAVPISYRDMAAAYPDLFETARAAETALQRENPTQTSIERFLIDVCVGFLSVTYRRPGSRGPGARLLYDARRVDPVAWLRERIGPVTILGEGAPVAEEPGEAVDAPTPQPAAADAPEPTLAAPNIPAPDPGPVVDAPLAATQSAIADPAGVPDTPEADPPPITSEQPPLATAPVAGVLAVWARDCAALRTLPPPPGFTRWRWRRVGDEAGMFVDRWGAEAIRLGWTVHDVFGAHDGAPTQRRDCMGLVVLLGDSSIVAIDPHGADVVTAGGARQRFRRRPMPIGTVTLAELARRWQLPSAEAA